MGELIAFFVMTIGVGISILGAVGSLIGFGMAGVIVAIVVVLLVSEGL